MTTRDRLDRHRSPLRLVLVLVTSTLVLLGIAAALAVALLPPVLAETPRERIAADTAETLRSATGSATVTVPSGWLVLGVGPFLAEDTATVVSPDDAYRAEFSVLPVSSDSAGRTAYTDLLAAHDVTTAEATATWNTETLSSGYSVRWTELTADDGATGGPSSTEAEGAAGEGDDRGSTIVLATLTAPGPAIPVELVLIATVSAADAAAYRTVTADLLLEATLSAPASTTPPPSNPRPTSTAPPTSSPVTGGGPS